MTDEERDPYTDQYEVDVLRAENKWLRRESGIWKERAEYLEAENERLRAEKRCHGYGCNHRCEECGK